MFEITPPGISFLDFLLDLAVEHGYWGYMPTTYCGPEHPIWKDRHWLRGVNKRFLAGRTAGD